MEIAKLSLLLILVGAGWYSPRLLSLVAVLLIPAYLVEFNIGGAPITLPEAATLLLLIATLPRLRRKAIFPLQPQRLELIAGALIALGLVLGFVYSSDPSAALGAIKGWFVIPSILGALIYYHWRNLDPAPVVLAIAASTLLPASAAIAQLIAGNYITFDYRASAWFGSPNHLALYLVTGMVLGAALLLLPRVGRWEKIVAGAATLLGAIALFASYSYGGWVAGIAGIIILGIYSRTRIVAVVLLAAGVLLGHQLATSERISNFLTNVEQTSLATRWQVWQVAINLGTNNWFSGIGLSDFSASYHQLVGTLFAFPREYTILHAHNFWLQTWLGLGVAGVAGFALLIGAHINRIYRSQHPLRVGLMAVTIAWLAHGLIDLPYFKYDLAPLFWLIIVLGYLIAPSYDKS